MPCILNAANEVVVEAFLNNRLKFLQMSNIIEAILSKAFFISHPSYEDYVQTDVMTRKLTKELIASKI
jgi:1-deoxy-D-xylulose-5-phosphate reductoisomerase